MNTKYHRMSLTDLHPVNSIHHSNAENCFSGVTDKDVIEQMQEFNSLGHLSHMSGNYVTSYKGSSMYVGAVR
jgi:hypothetical protein